MKRQQVEYKSFEIKSFDLNESTNEMFIEGFAASFNTLDEKQMTYNPEIGDFVLCSDLILPGSFSKTLSERFGRIAFCKNHDIDDAKGKILELREENEGLFVRLRISDAEPELKIKIKEKIYQEFSIGFKTIKAIFEKLIDNTYIRKISEIKLYEVSIVTIARNEFATVTDIKGIQSALSLIDKLITNEKNEIKILELNKLKSLIMLEPDEINPLDNKEPSKKSISKFEFNFK